MIGIAKISLLLALMISTAAIYAAQPWDDSSGWGDSGWVDEGAGSWDGDWSGADTGSWDSGSGGGDGNIGSSSNDYGGSNSWGSPIPAEMTSSDEAVFPSSISESSSTLIEEDSAQYAKRDIAYSMAAGGSSRNIFLDCLSRWQPELAFSQYSMQSLCQVVLYTFRFRTINHGGTLSEQSGPHLLLWNCGSI